MQALWAFLVTLGGGGAILPSPWPTAGRLAGATASAAAGWTVPLSGSPPEESIDRSGTEPAGGSTGAHAAPADAEEESPDEGQAPPTLASSEGSSNPGEGAPFENPSSGVWGRSGGCR